VDTLNIHMSTKLTLATSISIESGAYLTMHSGELVKVTAVEGDTLTIRKVPWYEHVWMWLRGALRRG